MKPFTLLVRKQRQGYNDIAIRTIGVIQGMDQWMKVLGGTEK